MIYERISDFLSYLALPEKKYSDDYVFQLGQSFEKDELVKSIKDIIKKKFTSQDTIKLDRAGIKKILLKGHILSNSLEKSIKFEFFVLLFNNYYNAHSNSFFSHSTVEIKIIAKALDIDRKDYENVLDFYFNDIPYLDKNDALYIAGKNDSQLIKSKGINVHFFGKKSNEILYLKYFKKYDLFLSKSYLPIRSKNSIQELIKTKEINLINKNNFNKSDFYFKNFNELVKATLKFDPFQYVKVESTDFSPEVVLDPVNSIIKIHGVSRPISTTSYFEPILEWIASYGKYGKDSLLLDLDLNHYNTYTMRFLLKLMKILSHYTNDDKDIKVIWRYEVDDDDSKDFGEQLKNLFGDKSKFLIEATDNIHL